MTPAEANRRRMKARSRAFHSLAAMHRADFLRLLDEALRAVDAEADAEAVFEAERAACAQHGPAVENYLFIGGDKMTAEAAAERLSVSTKSVGRYRAVLREAS